MQTKTVSRKRTPRILAALAATTVAAVAILFGAAPAHAATLQPALFPDRIEFLGNASNANVGGPVKLSIYPDGEWNIFSNTRNGRPAFRHVRWTCHVTVSDASSSTSIRVGTSPVRIRSKQRHTFDVSGTNANFANNYESIINPRFTHVDCSVHFGR